jgi:hypothetical protein
MLAYLIFQGRGMAERNMQQARQTRDELRTIVGFSVADEIEKLGRVDQRCRICTTAVMRLDRFLPLTSVLCNSSTP